MRKSKKIIGIFCSFFLLASTMNIGAFAAGALVSTPSIKVNGAEVGCLAYEIEGYNYFKLRDIAMALNGTGSQFEVGYNNSLNSVTLTTGSTYSPVGGELSKSLESIGHLSFSNVYPSDSAIYLNGSRIYPTAYNLDGYNYFKLRDIAAAVGFDVGYDDITGTILIDTPKQSATLAGTTWRGFYYNSSGEMDMRLTINQIDASGKISMAVFYFSPMPDNTKGKSGSYTMSGTYDKTTNRLSLSGKTWIDQPSLCYMVGLAGYVSGDEISGTCDGKECRLVKVGDNVVDDSMVGGWRGTYTNSDGLMDCKMTINSIDETGYISDAVFVFSPSSGNTKGKSGSYKMLGFFNPDTYEITLIGNEKISMPSDYTYMNFNGRLNYYRESNGSEEYSMSGTCSASKEFTDKYYFEIKKTK